MKVIIDYKKLIGKPFHAELDELFYFDKEKIEQLKNEILYGDSSSILISGYRGAGKTSFVKRVEKEINNEEYVGTKIHFVKLNLSKYNGYSYLIRKIIRAVYEAIPDTDLDNISKEEPELEVKLNLLYERTFNDVSAVNTIEHSYQNKRILKSTVNAKKVSVLFFSLIGAALNLKFNFSELLLDKEVLSKLINWIAFLVVGIWGSIKAFDLDVSWSKDRINKQTLNRQSLYDDEIAEHRLMEILKALKGLKKNKKRFVIVIDELDKIDISEVENIISELKSLMLGGYATFIIVAGQQLFYKYYHSSIEDDSILSSLFSNIVHIPLSDAETLKKIASP